MIFQFLPFIPSSLTSIKPDMYIRDIKSHLDTTLLRNIDLLTTKCFSVWLTALPIHDQEQGFHLNKQEF